MWPTIALCPTAYEPHSQRIGKIITTGKLSRPLSWPVNHTLDNPPSVCLAFVLVLWQPRLFTKRDEILTLRRRPSRKSWKSGRKLKGELCLWNWKKGLRCRMQFLFCIFCCCFYRETELYGKLSFIVNCRWLTVVAKQFVKVTIYSAELMCKQGLVVNCWYLRLTLNRMTFILTNRENCFRHNIKLVFHNYFPSIRKLFSPSFQNQTHLSILKLWDWNFVLLLQKAENYFPTLSPRVPGSSLSYNKPQSEKSVPFPPVSAHFECVRFSTFPRLFSKSTGMHQDLMCSLRCTGSWTPPPTIWRGKLQNFCPTFVCHQECY